MNDYRSRRCSRWRVYVGLSTSALFLFVIFLHCCHTSTDHHEYTNLSEIRIAMFSLSQPAINDIQHFIAAQQSLPHSYTEVGATRDTPPSGYVIDHNRIKLGTGRDTFVHAHNALRRWEMFNLHWLHLYEPTAPIVVGTTVAVLAHIWGLWIMNACRIVYVIDEIGPTDIFGFAYGTLPGHAERGEERFTVQWNHADDSVWYDILAFSRPNHWLARCGYLYVRQLQKRFARESLQAMFTASR
jgi:uncharacterized protein (UPF0548 family)